MTDQHSRPTASTLRGRAGELAVAAGTITLGVVVLVLSRQIVLSETVGNESFFDARTFPQVWGIALIVLGAWIAGREVVRLLRARAAMQAPVAQRQPVPEEPGATEHQPDQADTPPAGDAPGRVLAGVTVVAAYILLLPRVGYVIATIVVVGAMLLLMGNRSRWLLLALPLCTAGALFWIFTSGLSVHLP